MSAADRVFANVPATPVAALRHHDDLREAVDALVDLVDELVEHLQRPRRLEHVAGLPGVAERTRQAVAEVRRLRENQEER